MADIIGFQKRFSGPNKIHWSAEDIERMRKLYGLSKEQASEVIAKANAKSLTVPSVGKFASDDAATNGRFIASDGKYDRVNDLVDVAGINTKEHAANPIWHWMHQLDTPIGMEPAEKRNGRLESTLELGLGVYP